MKAQRSPLRCVGYYVTELCLTANPKHSTEDPVSLEFSDLLINTTVEPPKSDATEEREWRVALRVVQNTSDDKKNCPYNFAIALLGQFRVHPKYPAEQIEQLVKINGSSILYSSARQILRDAMGAGPFHPLLLPTVHFLDTPSDETESKAAEPETADGTIEE